MVVAVVVLTADATRDVAAPTATGVRRPDHRGDLSQLTDVREMTSVATTGPRFDGGPRRRPGLGRRPRSGPASSPKPAGSSWPSSRPSPGPASITVVEPDGTRQPAVWVGTDPTTGITVLRIPDDLPAADFTDERPGHRVGGRGHVRGVRDRRAASPVFRLYAGTVLYSGVATGTWQGTEFCETGVAAPLSSGDLGSPLVEPPVRSPGSSMRWSGHGIRAHRDLPPGRAGPMTWPPRSCRTGRSTTGAWGSVSSIAPHRRRRGGPGPVVQSVAAGGAACPGRAAASVTDRRRRRAGRALGGRAGHPSLR